MDDVERRYSEIQPPAGDSRILEGRVMRYGEISTGAPRPERFVPGAFEYGDVILNVQHDRGRPIARTGGGGLELINTREALNLRADVPQTLEGSDALVSVKSRILRGLSVEFRALKETFEAGVRVIHRAQLVAIGLVDSPAYTSSTVEARGIRGLRMSFAVPYKKRLRCECCPKSDHVEFAEDAFDEALANDKSDTLAVAGNYRGALASRKRGTLTSRKTDKALVVETEIADTQAGRDLVEQARDVPVLGRPILDFEKSAYEVGPDGVAKIQRAHLRGFIIGPSDADEGWSHVRIIREPEPRNRRRKKWL